MAAQRVVQISLFLEEKSGLLKSFVECYFLNAPRKSTYATVPARDELVCKTDSYRHALFPA